MKNDKEVRVSNLRYSEKETLQTNHSVSTVSFDSELDEQQSVFVKSELDVEED